MTTSTDTTLSAAQLIATWKQQESNARQQLRAKVPGRTWRDCARTMLLLGGWWNGIRILQALLAEDPEVADLVAAHLAAVAPEELSPALAGLGRRDTPEDIHRWFTSRFGEPQWTRTSPTTSPA
ncbi:hypothetical protein [Nonomuraea roseoviolacea]|uniref:HEAT repeat domain-containing protein n=1 Tax=Nonomuraea roseoviolacea subsp. carminata TaxID=160689 RepID=A0ABT1K991_9ACTN|nr:hypothetical protein [Nonomuraea roseoviolacea]MCP2350581.1 hypothetical protein [Nonomuraea roseoviolacea subsp. carminata]